MLVDMHFHIDSKWHGPEDVDKSIKDIETHGMLVAANSTDIPSYKETFEISGRSKNIFPAFGILPWYANEWFDRLDSIDIPIAEVGMLGEIGIDYAYSPPEAEPHMQQKLFEFFLKAAEENDLILNVHIRGADTCIDAREIMSSYDLKRVIMHSHYDTVEGMRDVADRGYYFTVGRGFVNPGDHVERINSAVKEIPEDLLLVEVDTIPREKWEAPSSLLKSLLQKLADFRGISTEDLESAVQKNALRIMRGVAQLEHYIKMLE
jgi:Tat protein secretion system quality control protein TatD with DNase activity